MQTEATLNTSGKISKDEVTTLYRELVRRHGHYTICNTGFVCDSLERSSTYHCYPDPSNGVAMILWNRSATKAPPIPALLADRDSLRTAHNSRRNKGCGGMSYKCQRNLVQRDGKLLTCCSVLRIRRILAIVQLVAGLLACGLLEMSVNISDLGPLDCSLPTLLFASHDDFRTFRLLPYTQSIILAEIN